MAAAASTEQGVVVLPRGNDGAAVVGSFAIEAPATLRLLIVDRAETSADIRARAAPYRRVTLALLGQDPANGRLCRDVGRICRSLLASRRKRIQRRHTAYLRARMRRRFRPCHRSAAVAWHFARSGRELNGTASGRQQPGRKQGSNRDAARLWALNELLSSIHDNKSCPMGPSASIIW